jgi:hypothetical protein
MDWFTLDSAFFPNEPIEGFNSFLWTERYSAYGDFQIVTASTYDNRQQLKVGTWVGMKGSYRTMMIDTVTDAVDDQGNKLITVIGKSLEALLNDRVAMPSITDTTTQPNWVLTGAPGDIARYMFDLICLEGALGYEDTIPFVHAGTLLAPGSLGEPSDFITVTFSPDTLYNSLKSLCDTYALGFRFVMDVGFISTIGDGRNIYFEIYTGDDRTSRQTDRNPVIFDANLETLIDQTTVTSSANLKTVAYVFATNGAVVVYAPTSDSTASGADRRVLLVNSSNSGDAGPALTTALQQEGLAALAQQQLVYSFDGQLPAKIPYVYGVDYNLGDLVEERNSDGFSSSMLVTEQIFSSDNTGEKSYPTLTLAQTNIPGTWATWTDGTDWADVPGTDYWGTV